MSTKGHGTSLSLGGVTFPIGSTKVTNSKCVNMGYYFSNEIELNCNIDLIDEHNIFDKCISQTFTIVFPLSQRQEKRRKRLLRRNSKRANGTRRAKRIVYSPIQQHIIGDMAIDQVKGSGPNGEFNVRFGNTTRFCSSSL